MKKYTDKNINYLQYVIYIICALIFFTCANKTRRWNAYEIAQLVHFIPTKITYSGVMQPIVCVQIPETLVEHDKLVKIVILG